MAGHNGRNTMGTRGFITFVIDGREKTAYNHFDSYPDGLGQDVLTWLRVARDGGLPVRELRVVSPDSKPTAEDIARLSRFSWGGAQHGGGRDLRDGQEWYDLLRETQGSPHDMLAAGVIEDAFSFPQDSLFAEWGYVVDLDARCFEVYEGFQRAPHGKGRFASRPGLTGGYAPVALRASWPLDALPTDQEFADATTDSDE